MALVGPRPFTVICDRQRQNFISAIPLSDSQIQHALAILARRNQIQAAPFGDNPLELPEKLRNAVPVGYNLSL